MSVFDVGVLCSVTFAVSALVWYNWGFSDGRIDGMKESLRDAEAKSPKGDEIDWEYLRVLVARESLEALIGNGGANSSSCEESAKAAAGYADELVKRLKENKS